MAYNHRKSVTHRLVQAARAHRQRAGSHLGRLNLHPGQEQILKALGETDGMSMGEIAQTLNVQPPTVTKMVTRLGAQGFVVRQASETDGRLARVFLTEMGRERLGDLDRSMKRLEKEALVGIEEKDRKKLKKLLKIVERNLAHRSHVDEDDPTLDEDDTDEDEETGAQD
ncbi:MAG: MarR family transcriptional regulator [Hyphomicrobiaceae bacterium]|nr:MarR family transcriptional regulator [Hyphomicrobiaceae bacterium]